MTDWPAATYADHNTFCANEGWRVVRNAHGKAGKHHITYELDLVDGRTLRTRISRPANRTDYGPALWSFILREQLDTTEDQFWACVRNKIAPDRGVIPAPVGALNADIVFGLIRAGFAEGDIKTMTKPQAIAALNDHWTRPNA